jgi:hypothetical protein
MTMEKTVFERYIDQRFNSIEGESGSRNLTDMFEAMGYGQGWMRGRAMEEFFGDNPGAVEAILMWVEENVESIPEWEEGLASELMEEEYED